MELLSTSSLENILPPSAQKYITGTKTLSIGNKIVNIQKEISTGSLETITPPSETKYLASTKSSPIEKTIISTKNIIDDFHQEILEYSARYIKRHISFWDADKNTITVANVLLDYGTEGPTADNFEVIINGIHSPTIYTVKQNGNDIVISFSERLFSYDGLQIENIIVIGKLLDL
jgi:hypothetical protein